MCPRVWYDWPIRDSFKSLFIWITTAALKLGIPNSLGTKQSSKHPQWITCVCASVILFHLNPGITFGYNAWCPLCMMTSSNGNIFRVTDHLCGEFAGLRWINQMETFSALLAICAGNSPVSGEFPTQRPVTRSFDVFFDLHPNKRLSKQWWGWWF